MSAPTIFCQGHKGPLLALLAMFVLLLAPVLAQAQEITPESLAHRWQAVGAADGEALELDDSLMRFNWRGASGRWALAGDSLILTHDLPDSQSGVDSVAVLVRANEPGLALFSQGRQVGFLLGASFDVGQVRQRLAIERCAPDTLALRVETGQRLVFWRPYQASAPSLGFDLASILRGMLGLLVIIAIAYAFSTNRKAVSWRVVGIGLGVQFLLAISILKVPAVQSFFEVVGKMFIVVLDFTKEGSVFLLGGMMDTSSYGFIFAFQVLPTIIFFSALTSLLFYWGIIQKVVYLLAAALTKLLRISGAESLAVAGNIFLGQTESPLLIKAYLEKMNRSEILLVMSAGMATLAGGVLAAYVAFLGGDDPVMRLYFAKHLLTASIMAAPGAVVVAKIIVPQTEPIDTQVQVSKEKIGSNALDAISNGTTEGLKLAANVAAMLLVFIAFIAMANFILVRLGGLLHVNGLIADFTGGQYDGLSLQFLLGYLFAPIVWVMGVSSEDMALVGRLVGEKLIMTEFIAYVSLADLKEAGMLSQKSIVMATYALCGFANFASIGIQIGGIGSLAPGQRKTLSEFGLRALLAGSLASLVSATMVGMILG